MTSFGALRSGQPLRGGPTLPLLALLAALPAIEGCMLQQDCTCIAQDADGRILAELSCGQAVCLDGAQYECVEPGGVRQSGACPHQADGTVMAEPRGDPTGSTEQCVGIRPFRCNDLSPDDCGIQDDCYWSGISDSCKGDLPSCDQVRDRGYCLRVGCYWVDSPAEQRGYCPPRATAVTGVGPSVFSGTLGAGADNHFTSRCSLSEDYDRAMWWTAPGPGRYRIDTYGSIVDTILAVRGGCHEPALVCNDDDFETVDSALEIELRAAGPVLLVVSSWGHEEGGYVVNIQRLP